MANFWDIHALLLLMDIIWILLLALPAYIWSREQLKTLLQNIFNSDEISDYPDNSPAGSVEKIALMSESWTINKLEGDLVCLRQIQIQRKS